MSYRTSERSKIVKFSYLADLDAINKYSLQSPYLVPSLSGVSIELPLQSLGSNKTKSQKSLTLAKGLAIFFLLFGCLPEIVYKNAKLSKKQRIFSLKHTLSTKQEIFSFLTVYFAFTISKTDLVSYDLFKKPDSFIQDKSKLMTKLVLSKTILARSFLEVKEFFLEKGWSLDDEVFFNFSFIFANTVSLSKANSMVQNIYPF